MYDSPNDHIDDDITSTPPWEVEWDTYLDLWEGPLDDAWVDYETLAPRPVQPDTLTNMNGR